MRRERDGKEGEREWGGERGIFPETLISSQSFMHGGPQIKGIYIKLSKCL